MSWLGGPRIDLDLPVPGSETGLAVEIAGWAFARRSAIERVEVVVGDAAPVRLSYGLARPDVAAAHGCDVACGFSGVVPLQDSGAGLVTLRVEALDARGRRAGHSVVVQRRAAVSAPLESPAPRAATAEPPVAPEAPLAELRALLQDLRNELDRDPSVLDLSGLGLAPRLPGELVVTPLVPGRLPYADRSFDVVIVKDGDASQAEPRRLASGLLVELREDGVPRTLWRAPAGAAPLPRVSVVIPVFNRSDCTDACLASVAATWPAELDGEVLVVDDGSTDDTPALLEAWSARDPRVRGLRLESNQGFIAACNAGAAVAAGDVLVFLNNDTLARPGWLAPLVAGLGRDKAGAVGGKLLYPDGTLQEAGGVVFDDADGCNFGKGDPEPDHPIFDHVRDVDYCSGALLATPRALFLELGGFDPAYAPAYYEDADYAFRLRERGYRVYYQPASSVVHLEGATAGRDLASGVKRHQVRNRVRFAERWAQALTAQPAHPAGLDRNALHALQARGRHPRRALVVLPTMPELDRECGSRRAFHMIELLLEARWAVSVVVENATNGERYARALRQLGATVYAGPATRDPGVERLPDPSLLLAREPFDLALVAFWHVAERYVDRLRALSPATRLVVDSVDLHFLRQARGGFASARRELRGQPLDGRFGDEMRRELNAYAAADGVLTVSEKEAGWIDDLLAQPGHARCVPLMEDVSGALRPLEERRGLVFLGNFRHPPNVDALAFLADVLEHLDPALLARHPLSIVGNALETRLLGPLAQHPHVHAVGWVPAVEPYLERARVSLVPLRHGAGTKGKVLQSLLAGTPCVSTSIGIEGLDVADGREVLVADTAQTFATAIVRLLEDDVLWRKLSPAGRAVINRDHGRAVVGQTFAAALAAALTRGPRAAGS
jgi:GT2 family glycosyltransferase